MITLKQFFSLLRLSHWSKSAFVFLGVIYSKSLSSLGLAFLAALSFCLIAGAVYIYNDLFDREVDRLHPKKCRRPLANDEISLDAAILTMAGLALAGLLLGWLISSTLAAILGLYLLINLLYNHLFKVIPILDVLSIASGFMLRVFAGTLGIGLPITWWLIITASLLSLFIAFCKRRLEKQMNLYDQTRVVLKKYTIQTLDYLIAMSATGCFVSYLLYTVIAHDQAYYFLLTLPFAAIGLWRFAWLSTQESENDDPITLFFNDNLSRLNLLSFMILTLIALY